MTESEKLQEIFIKQVVENLLKTESGLSRFIELLQLANLEKDLLQISSYESSTFILNKDNIFQTEPPKIDRLTLVYPPSFAFSANYQISGYFKVKYTSAGNSLPIQMKPFIVNYSGILIPNGEHFEIKSEKVENLIN
jgi:hypothetical protein